MTGAGKRFLPTEMAFGFKERKILFMHEDFAVVKKAIFRD